MQGLKLFLLLFVVFFGVMVVGLWFLTGEEEGPAGTQAAAPPATPVKVDAPEVEDAPEPAVRKGSGNGGLTGRILLFKTRQPVADVIVRLTAGPGDFEPVAETTDPEGWFRFENLPAGAGYELRVAHGEYAPLRRLDLQVVTGEMSDIGVLFLEQAVSFVVRVVDGSGKPIPEATVNVYTASGPRTYWRSDSWIEQVLKATEIPTPLVTAETDEAGEAHLKDLPAGYYSLAAEAEGYARAGVEKLISPDTQSEPVVLKLGKGYTLRGRVTDAEGRPVAGRVLVTPGTTSFAWGSSFLRAAVPIDPEGNYEIKGLPPGPSSLLVAREGSAAFPAGAVSIPDLERYDIRLTEGARVEGTVTDAQGDPVEGAEIRVTLYRRMGSQYFGASATSDKDGHYEIVDLPPGSLQSILVVKEGFARYPPPGAFQQNHMLSSGTSLRLDVKLRKGGSLTGRVTRKSDQKPLSGARVVAIPRSTWGGGAWETATTGEDGTYRIEALAAGEYAIQVVAEGCFQEKFPGTWQAGRAGYKLDERWLVTVPLGGEEVEKNLELAVGGVIKGRVESNDGEPVAGARISVSGASNQLPVVTDRSGEFEVKGIKAGGRVYVYANAPGRWARSDPLSLAPGGRLEGVVLRMKATVTVSGTVELSDGTMPEGGVATLVNGDPRRNRWLLNSGGMTTPIGPDGSFRFEGVTPGMISVVARVPGYMKGFSDPQTVPEGTDLDGVRVILQAGYTISGYVRLKTGEPVEGAQITVQEDQGGWYDGSGSGTVAQTGPGGHFTVSGLGDGKYQVSARKEGYSPARKAGVLATSGQEVELEMEEGGTITGRVFDMQGNGVGGMQVTLSVLTGQPPPILPSTSTSGDGTFKLTGVLDGYYRVMASPGWASKLNYTSGFKDGVRPGDTDVEIQVQSGFRITGTVLDPEGKPMARIRVWSTPVDGGGRRANTQTEADGTFELTGLSPGNHNVTVEARGEYATTTEPNVGAGTEGLTLTIGRARTIEGIVVDPDGNPARGVSVSARPMPGTTGTNRWASTGRDGRFRLTRLAPGVYQLTFAANGRFATQTVPDVAAGTTGLGIRMEIGETIAGLAVDREGRPVAGSRITAMPVHGGPSASATTNNEGKFRIVGLNPGPHRLTATANKDGYVLDDPVEAETGRTDVKLVLREGLSIRGQIVDRSGKGLRGWVYIVKGGGRMNGRWISTDRDGNFTIVGLNEGSVTLRTWASGHGQVEVQAQAGDQAVQLQVE